MAITDHTDTTRILVAGCGKLGTAIACSLCAPSTRVYGLRRNPSGLPEEITGIAADLMQPESLRDAVPEHLDIVIYCLTPSSYDQQGYRDAYVTGLNHLLQALKNPLKRLIFISSTSVYAQDDDSWVDETSETCPARFSGQQILAGEQTTLDSGQPATIIRFSGIYGPTRKRFLEEVIEGRMNPLSPAPFSNRIHEEDAAAAVAHLSQMALSGQPLETHYIVSDCEPVRLDDVVRWVREQVPCKDPVADARQGGRAGSKRCSNRRLLDTGFRFRYPDFRAGYRAMIDQEQPRP